MPHACRTPEQVTDRVCPLGSITSSQHCYSAASPLASHHRKAPRQSALVAPHAVFQAGLALPRLFAVSRPCNHVSCAQPPLPMSPAAPPPLPHQITVKTHPLRVAPPYRTQQPLPDATAAAKLLLAFRSSVTVARHQSSCPCCICEAAGKRQQQGKLAANPLAASFATRPRSAGQHTDNGGGHGPRAGASDRPRAAARQRPLLRVTIASLPFMVPNDPMTQCAPCPSPLHAASRLPRTPPVCPPATCC